LSRETGVLANRPWAWWEKAGWATSSRRDVGRRHRAFLDREDRLAGDSVKREEQRRLFMASTAGIVLPP